MKHLNSLLTLLILLCGTMVSGQTAAINNKPEARFEETRRLFLSPKSGVVLVAAHRGAHNEVPENSMASFRKAIELGVDIIELDIRATKDGVLVLMHDKTVDRTTNGKGRVDSLNFAEIRSLRLKHNGVVTDEQVPTFAEALQLTRNRILVDLDIKAGNKSKEIIAEVKKYKAERSVIFFVYNAQQLKMVKEVNPDLLVLARTHKEEDIAPLFEGYKANAIHIDEHHHTAGVVNLITGLGGRVWINSLGAVDKQVAAAGPEAFEAVLEKNANIVQTDYPGLLLKYLSQRGKRGSL